MFLRTREPPLPTLNFHFAHFLIQRQIICSNNRLFHFTVDDHDANYTRLDIFRRRLVLFSLTHQASTEIQEVHDKQAVISKLQPCRIRIRGRAVHPPRVVKVVELQN